MNTMFKLLLENSPCPIWICDLDLNYLYMNEAYMNIFNLVKEEVVGKNIIECLPLPMSELMRTNYLDVIKSGSYRVFETVIENSHKIFHIIPLIEDNKLILLAGIILDINALKETELKLKNQNYVLQTIIDTIPNVIFYKNSESNYMLANKRCKEFYKGFGVDDIIGKNELEINPDKLLAQQLLKVDHEILESKQGQNCEEVMLFNDGTVQYREVLKAPVLGDDSQVIGIVGISRDITERKLFEEELKYLSYRDSLTNVYNRTYFEERIKQLQDESYLPIGLIMGDVNGLKLINDAFGHLEGDQLLKNIANILKQVCGEAGDIFRWGGDEFTILIPNTNKRMCEHFIQEIKKACKVCDETVIEHSISLGFSIVNRLDVELYDVLKEVEEKVYRHKLLQHNSMYSSMLNSLQKTLEAKSMETELHTERMVAKALVIGEQMGLSMDELDELTLATKLHDIGKIGISEDILLKPSRLTDEEYEIMKTHTEKGYRIVMATNGLSTVARGVLCHHEKFDGTGYPLGLKGNEIPLIARIISVVDAYDAMTHKRSYHQPMSHELAIAEIKRSCGIYFDPEVVRYFLSHFEFNED